MECTYYIPIIIQRCQKTNLYSNTFRKTKIIIQEKIDVPMNLTNRKTLLPLNFSERHDRLLNFEGECKKKNNIYRT